MTYGEILDADSIKKVRRDRKVTGVATASSVLGTPDPTPLEPLVPKSPRETADAGRELVLKSFLDDPVKFKLLADMLRMRDPALAGFSNEQLKSIAISFVRSGDSCGD